MKAMAQHFIVAVFCVKYQDEWLGVSFSVQTCRGWLIIEETATCVCCSNSISQKLVVVRNCHSICILLHDQWYYVKHDANSGVERELFAILTGLHSAYRTYVPHTVLCTVPPGCTTTGTILVGQSVGRSLTKILWEKNEILRKSELKIRSFTLPS